MHIDLEICVDSWESLVAAVSAGADRIELCASLREGGLTPSAGFIEAALEHAGSRVPVFVMIRPRSCDFLYGPEEIEVMHRDVAMARRLGAPGVVFGVLTAAGDLDRDAMRSLVGAASGMQVTCHRAVDQARDVLAAVDRLAGLGVDRILSSGQAESPLAGLETLCRMTEVADRRIKIMAAGVTPEDVREIILRSAVDEVHSAALTWRASRMEFVADVAKMGHGEDFSLGVVDPAVVRALKAAIRAIRAS